MTKPTPKNEKGIALIFSLIMLSLLLIMALSFALDSMYDQKAAYNSANKSSAALLAKSQFEQVFMLINEGAAHYDSDQRIYSYDQYTTSPTDDIYTDMLKERMPVLLTLPEDDPTLSPTPTEVKWNYIRETGDGSRIIGRTAFVVVPDVKVPLDSLVDHRVGISLYHRQNEKDNTETRIGKYVSEINVRNAIPAMKNDANIDNICEILNFQTNSPVSGAGFSNGLYTGNWVSYTNLFTTLNGVITPALSADDEKEIRDKLDLDVDEDKEAFWADLDNNEELDDSTELFKRFDLTRAQAADPLTNNWDMPATFDLLFLKRLISIDAATGTSIDRAIETWSATDETAGAAITSGIPWLACFGYQADGSSYSGADLDRVKASFDSVFARRCQIAANLKDYSDSDDRPTSDEAVADWYKKDEPHPTFTGNERTPYINKIGIQVQIRRDNADIWGTEYTYIYKDITPCVELINIYGSDFTDLDVVIYGNLTTELSTDNGNTYATPVTEPFSRTIQINSGDWISGRSNLAFGATVSSNENWLDWTSPTQLKITNIEIIKVVLHARGVTETAYDYVKTLNINPALTALPNTLINDTRNYFFGFAVHDSRQNLNSSDWKELPFSSSSDASTVLAVTATGSTPAYTCYPNWQNTNGASYCTDAPNAGTSIMDKETATDPANCNLSTAYIRNAPIQSPWELGFIHRGAKWQTLNLKVYDSEKAIKTFEISGVGRFIAGGGLYEKGDANILDQVRMTYKAKSPQKITLKAPQNKIFNTLFSDIKYGCAIQRDDADSTKHMNIYSLAGLDNAATGTSASGTVLSTANISTLGSGIIDKFKSSADSAIRTRACVVDKLVLSGTSSPSLGTVTDAAQEELIGKVINLTKIGSPTGNSTVTSFSVVVLAQTIKDIGGEGVDISVTKRSLDGTQSATRNCRIGTFDATINSTTDESIYFDEITGEQKLLVRCKTDSSGNIEIASFKYIE